MTDDNCKPSSAPVFRRGPIRAPTDKATEEHILDIRNWTKRLLSFRVTRPAAFRFQPGQFARLGIASEKGGMIWRAYSMVSASYDEYLEFFSIIVPDGAFTTRLARFVPDDPLHVEKQPYGYLTTSRFVGGQDLWMLASGTGIAPFLSILRDPEVWERFDNLVLAYSVREAGDLAYRKEIAALARDELFAPNGHKLRFAPIITREHVPGMLDRRLTELLMDGKLEKFVSLPLDTERARILVCGNPQMLDDMRGVLTGRGLRPDRSREPGHFAFENYW
ncbi:MAG: ferredoxin--NADP reductase [Sterolibacterium sp.]|nr:ferredoxin--NADP reductase [Sterolibacterium sp.]